MSKPKGFQLCLFSIALGWFVVVIFAEHPPIPPKDPECKEKFNEAINFVKREKQKEIEYYKLALQIFVKGDLDYRNSQDTCERLVDQFEQAVPNKLDQIFAVGAMGATAGICTFYRINYGSASQQDKQAMDDVLNFFGLECGPPIQ